MQDLSVSITYINTCQSISQPDDELKGFNVWYKGAYETTKKVIQGLRSIGARNVEIIEGKVINVATNCIYITYIPSSNLLYCGYEIVNE